MAKKDSMVQIKNKQNINFFNKKIREHTRASLLFLSCAISVFFPSPLIAAHCHLHLRLFPPPLSYQSRHSEHKSLHVNFKSSDFFITVTRYGFNPFWLKFPQSNISP